MDAANEADEGDEHAPITASTATSSPTETDVVAVSGLKHDPATRMLIEEELRDASPAEKAEWNAFLQTVETSEVPELLKERRMASRRESEQLAPGARKNFPEEMENVFPIAHSLAANAKELEPEAEAARAHDEAEDGDHVAASEFSAGSAWQKKFRTLADPNRLWPHAGNEPASQAEHSLAPGKPERGSFGRPAARNRRDEIVTASANTSPATPSPQQTAALETRITPGSAFWEDDMSKLISLLEAEASSVSPAEDANSRIDIRKQVGLRMLYLVANEPQKAFQAIPGLPPEDQEFWTSIFQGLAEHLNQVGANDPAERATQTLAHLRTAAYHLQQTANLRLRNLTFCQQINGFGNYETFPANEFDAGQTVLIYSEIRNFKSVPTDDGHYLTRIRSTIEIYTTHDGQRLVDRNAYDPTEDRSRSLRTDYYHSYRLDLPANLTPGPHLVKVILQDELTGKQATESIPFTIK